VLKKLPPLTLISVINTLYLFETFLYYFTKILFYENVFNINGKQQLSSNLISNSMGAIFNKAIGHFIRYNLKSHVLFIDQIS
jgi:hypothetical protein